jgi:hypothetical protein
MFCLKYYSTENIRFDFSKNNYLQSTPTMLINNENKWWLIYTIMKKGIFVLGGFLWLHNQKY